MKNLENFSETLRSNENNSEPIFEIDAILSTTEIVMSPSPTEVYNIIIHSVKDLLERLNSFARWMNGTCIPCNPITSGDDQYIYSFFEDIISIPKVCDITNALQRQTNTLVSKILSYLSQ